MPGPRVLLLVSDDFAKAFQSHFSAKGFHATIDSGAGDVCAQLFNSQLEGNSYTHLLVDLTLAHLDMAVL